MLLVSVPAWLYVGPVATLSPKGSCTDLATWDCYSETTFIDNFRLYISFTAPSNGILDAWTPAVWLRRDRLGKVLDLNGGVTEVNADIGTQRKLARRRSGFFAWDTGRLLPLIYILHCAEQRYS